MGVSISVYDDVKIIDEQNENEDMDYSFQVYVSLDEEDQKFKVKNLEYGRYYEGVGVDGIDYSYSTHNRFREYLMKLIGREDLLDDDGKIKWEILSDNSDIPFYNLINFSDCEGCFDWEISQKLYKDFETFNEKNKEMSYFLFGYYQQYYHRWLDITKEGSKVNSVVNFN